MAERSTVLLLHGIWMRPWVLRVLARRLRAVGYEVVIPAYASVTRTPAENAARLYGAIQGLSSDYLHVVGHSLGGIVALHLLSQYPQLPPGRLVTLGTPVRGSQVARTVRPLPLLGKAFGSSMEQGLAGAGVPTALGWEWGAIIGTLPVGLGFPFLRGQVHDGAVSVGEAEHPAQTARLYLRLSHTGLLFSATACAQIHQFLQTGQFSPPKQEAE